ncbi:hypothetical protein BU26DRAFT_207337 [Trematosphaeria pertusa]|uniref:Uncharacterized protein n=1 Tax=Trematosphaeria pertusa TaxID=390896 RepID=A0A6A6HSW6_9PLEO|nr:uncharacterized protein BU26DRAFT_207337 [Trematosphaeria pertusa]KAF2240530.1 hypothetical protein BU26DRAFT_207337 [Trematosphaeria pertusa]
MPPFLDRVQLDHALHNQAVPLLEAIAANDHLRNRSLRRFERDDPPPYAESTESEEFDDAPPPPLRGELPEELQAIMDRPICTDELKRYGLESTLQPGDFYYSEAMLEKSRVTRYRANNIFRGVEGSRRLGVLVRHNVKRRWEKLGVWNPEWGFPGRRVQPNDDVFRWKWPWQQHEADGSEPSDLYTQQLLARALHLRQGLRRGESSPVIPRSHLKRDASVSEAESFIISRPWFIFQVEIAEERARHFRLSNEQRQRYPHSAHMQVIEWWKERGDWRDEFNRTDCVTSWKWSHESPSPEPEDLTPINNMTSSPLDTADIDFTASEVDDLETIELPPSEHPPHFWTIPDGFGFRTYPGQTIDVSASVEQLARDFPPPSVPNPIRLFGPTSPPPKEHEDASLELEEKLSTPPQQDLMSPPPQNPQRRSQRQRQAQGKVTKAKDQNTPPPPRRSARIAGMKRPADPLPLQAAPNKKPRGRATPKAAVPATQHTTPKTRRRKPGRVVPARPPPKESSKTRSRRTPRIRKKT